MLVHREALTVHLILRRVLVVELGKLECLASHGDGVGGGTGILDLDLMAVVDDVLRCRVTVIDAQILAEINRGRADVDRRLKRKVPGRRNRAPRINPDRALNCQIVRSRIALGSCPIVRRGSRRNVTVYLSVY